ncbi:hypothetical protein OAS47_02945 [Pelagibacteraceae bacterium]|nr:hypothetical protein [Pelagibacteraceae bacterium]
MSYLINFKSKKVLMWVAWLILVILWNYGFPKAEPMEDVIVAVVLALVNFYFSN